LPCRYVGEIFADRAYNEDATLVDRSIEGAVIHDPALAADRITEMVLNGSIITRSGQPIKARIDTICLHGDTPNAVLIARSVREALNLAGVGIRSF